MTAEDVALAALTDPSSTVKLGHRGVDRSFSEINPAAVHDRLRELAGIAEEQEGRNVAIRVLTTALGGHVKKYTYESPAVGMGRWCRSTARHEVYFVPLSRMRHAR